MHSALDDIPSIGTKTKSLLLKHFKSLKRIREASEADLAAVMGSAKARKLLETLK